MEEGWAGAISSTFFLMGQGVESTVFWPLGSLVGHVFRDYTPPSLTSILTSPSAAPKGYPILSGLGWGLGSLNRPKFPFRSSNVPYFSTPNSLKKIGNPKLGSSRGVQNFVRFRIFQVLESLESLESFILPAK